MNADDFPSLRPATFLLWYYCTKCKLDTIQLQSAFCFSGEGGFLWTITRGPLNTFSPTQFYVGFFSSENLLSHWLRRPPQQSQFQSASLWPRIEAARWPRSSWWGVTPSLGSWSCPGSQYPHLRRLPAARNRRNTFPKKWFQPRSLGSNETML